MALPTLVRRGLDPLELAQREFDGMLGRLVGGRFFDGGSNAAVFPVDVREDADHVYVEAELPGFKKEEVNVDLENGMLTVSAEHKTETQEKGAKKGDWLLHERRYDRFRGASRSPQRSMHNPCRRSSMRASLRLRSPSAKRPNRARSRFRKSNVVQRFRGGGPRDLHRAALLLRQLIGQ